MSRAVAQRWAAAAAAACVATFAAGCRGAAPGSSAGSASSPEAAAPTSDAATPASVAQAPAPEAAVAREASAAALPPGMRGARVVFRDGDPPAFAADAQAILAELEAWRGLPFLRDLEVEIAPQSEVEDPKLAGWYEPSTRRLVVVEGRTDRMSRGTLLHEMHHALQDQHFDLAALHRKAAHAGADAERALQALIEGEAMLAVSERMDYDFEQHAHLPEEGPLDAARFEKIFHYGAGLRYARALRDAGGWERVDAAFLAPPSSTAEIYRPERELDSDRWIARMKDPRAARLLQDVPSGTEPLGAYELHLRLARVESLRARSRAIAERLIADEAWVDGDAQLWLLWLEDEETARELANAAPALGALEEPRVEGGIVRLRLPREE